MSPRVGVLQVNNRHPYLSPAHIPGNRKVIFWGWSLTKSQLPGPYMNV